MANKKLETILIVDDSELNRSILSDMLCDNYEIIEAENGEIAITYLLREDIDISLILLDVVMPKKDGFDVLAMMNRYNIIKTTPVIMITAETSSSVVRRAYELGVSDFINRPFEPSIVQKRITNTLALYEKQKKLVNLVIDQIYEKQKNSSIMINILSHIVEFRNGESGLHILHINTITEILLKALIKKTDKYNITKTDVGLISTASSLHDIGKIQIPDEILNKPGRLTSEEFEIMKNHSIYGAEILDKITFYRNEPLVKYSYEICRWHHERWDGRGYPDGLKGDEIPISAQIVSIADVYDALRSERCYKKAYTHEESISMIVNGECGQFNPLLIECLLECQEELMRELSISSISVPRVKTEEVLTEIEQHNSFISSERTLNLFKEHQTKTDLLSEVTKEIQFEYDYESSIIKISSYAAKLLGKEDVFIHDFIRDDLKKIFNSKDIEIISKKVDNLSPDNPSFKYDCYICINNVPKWSRLSILMIWNDQGVKHGIIGKIWDMDEDHKVLLDLEKKANIDALTGLYNSYAAKRKINKLLKDSEKNYIFGIIDLDDFKQINDHYGHYNGNKVLKQVASTMIKNYRNVAVCGRIGGDEYIIFMEENDFDPNPFEELYNTFNSNLKSINITVSIGFSTTKLVGRRYQDLFVSADKALYTAKKRDKNQYCIYDESINDLF